MEAAECLSFGAHRVERSQGSTCFGVINAVLKVTARPKHVITHGGSVQCGLISTVTLGEQNFKWEKKASS